MQKQLAIAALVLLSNFSLQAKEDINRGSILRVMIDPGHGGTDSGAVRGSARESDIALKVSYLLHQMLIGDFRFSSLLTRTTDVNLSLPERIKLTDKSQADILISIHANSATDRRAKGVEIYFQNHLPADEDSLFLANAENKMLKANTEMQTDNPSKRNDVLSILEDLKRNHRMNASHQLSQKISAAWNPEANSAIHQAPFYVVSKANVPSVLVELGFITNPKEADKLLSAEYQKEIAQRIYKGLIDYKDLMDKGQTPSLN